MVSSVKSRPDHYETLGLTPKASDHDIEDAYADFVARIRKSPRMHPRQVVELSRGVLAAYKTLRDPIKRREYDTSLGLAPKPKRQRKTAPFITATPEAPAQRGADAHIREGSAAPAKPRADETAPAPAPQPETHRQEGRAERVGPFIAATLRGYEPHAEPEQRTEAPAEPSPDPLIARDDEFDTAENVDLESDADERGSERKWVMVGLGGFVLTVALLALLIWPWGGNRTPSLPPARTAATGEPAATRSQASPEQPLQADEGAPQLADETGPAPTDQASAMNNAPPVASPRDEAVETKRAARPESSAVASSADPLAPEPTQAGTNAPDPLAPRPPAEGAQSPPTPIAQPVVRGAVATPPAQPGNRSRPAKWISGGLANADNAGGWFEGTVTVQFTVKPNGQVTGCRPRGSSGKPALDARTCGLLQQRLLFSPALDSQGRAVATQMTGTYTWGRNQRQKKRR